ncbi:MAG: hypothetical protein DRH32_02990 [Deltaproteobacteria bacterium]|nr:MAG: hypothetical protein DRH32_02990 [Deltaproteobacteria bacterium]
MAQIIDAINFFYRNDKYKFTGHYIAQSTKQFPTADHAVLEKINAINSNRLSTLFLYRVLF